MQIIITMFLNFLPPGVFAMLDEECMVPNGSDQGFVNKLVKQHKTHRRFDIIRTKQSW
jgi:myosin V